MTTCFCGHALADHGEDQSKASPDAWCQLCGCAYYEIEQVVVLPVVPATSVVEDLGVGDEEDYVYSFGISWF